MKKLGLFICFVIFSIGMYAQHGPRERIKAFKIAYLTEELDLSSKEAQQFWPIYNMHEEKVEKLRKKERKLIRTIRESINTHKDLSDQEAGDFINAHLEVKDGKSQIHKELILNLKNVLPNKKILKFIKAEADFRKRMLDRMKQRRKGH